MAAKNFTRIMIEYYGAQHKIKQWNYVGQDLTTHQKHMSKRKEVSSGNHYMGPTVSQKKNNKNWCIQLRKGQNM